MYMDLLKLGLLILIVYYILHNAYVYVIGFILLSLLIQLFSKNPLWYLLLPIIFIHLCFYYFHNVNEGFRRKKKKRNKRIKRWKKAARKRARKLKNKANKFRKKQQKRLLKTGLMKTTLNIIKKMKSQVNFYKREFKKYKIMNKTCRMVNNNISSNAIRGMTIAQ